jgi:hypothetical protein
MDSHRRTTHYICGFLFPVSAPLKPCFHSASMPAKVVFATAVLTTADEENQVVANPQSYA